jgi:hypothetical protein
VRWEVQAAEEGVEAVFAGENRGVKRKLLGAALQSSSFLYSAAAPNSKLISPIHPLMSMRRVTSDSP